MQFLFFVLNLVKINIGFFQRLVDMGPSYRPSMPSMYYQFGRFIDQACQNSQMERADLFAKRGN